MSRYIDAEKIDFRLSACKDSGEADYITISDVRRILAEVPDEDVEKVVHAHWEYYYDSWRETNLRCSQCGYKTNYKTKRCEACDAKMDEEVHAHWIVTINKHIFPEERRSPNFWRRCSNCGKTYGAYVKSEIDEMKECPRCKAKMDEVIKKMNEGEINEL